MASIQLSPLDELAASKSPRPDAAAKNVDVESGSNFGACFYVLAFFSFLLIFLFFPFSMFYAIKIVKEYERAVILRLGRLTSRKAKGPGLFFVLPCVDDVRVIDLRIVTYDVPPQEILTKDSVTVQVDAVVYFRIYDPTASVVNVENAMASTWLYAWSTLRNILGTKSLSEVLSERKAISEEMSIRINKAADPWGVKVEKVEIKDVSLPLKMQRSMAAEAEASRGGKGKGQLKGGVGSKVIAAEGEQRSSKKLREAADIIDESPAALQLRYLQTLNTIAAENNHTYVFPLPIDLLSRLLGR